MHQIPADTRCRFNDAGDAKDTDESVKTNNLLSLKNGDTKSLVGISFGDEFDYDLFDISGYVNGANVYCQKGSETNDLKFFFNGEGQHFSGLAVSWDGSFFGIELGEDTLETLIPILGEPDTYQEKDQTNGIFAIYNFENATLSVNLVEDKIRSVEYMATEAAARGKKLPKTQTDFFKDRADGSDYAETIYNWGTSYAHQTDASYHPYDEDYEERKTGAFIKNYLQAQGISKNIPDGVSYNRQGDPLVEYYIDKEKNQYCFVIHLWGDYWIDYEAGTSKYRDAVYCTTHIPYEADKAGNLIYSYEEEPDITRERLYDAQGKRMADISYEYFPEIPFPFITEYWNINTAYDLISNVLCRNQKTWFYKEQSLFDKAGNIKAAEYLRSSYSHGTTDSSGTIEYDEKGRMISNEYYVTHGGHTNIFLYEEEAERPWACFYWCSMGPGFENVYLFLPDNP